HTQHPQKLALPAGIWIDQHEGKWRCRLALLNRRWGIRVRSVSKRQINLESCAAGTRPEPDFPSVTLYDSLADTQAERVAFGGVTFREGIMGNFSAGLNRRD